MRIKYLFQIWRLSNKYGFSNIGFFKFLVGYLFLPSYKLVYESDKKNDKVMGFNFIENKRIKRLVVDEEYRGRGIGKKLVPDYCNLVYTDKKRNAKDFYEKLGFRIVGKKESGAFIMKR